MTRVESTRAKVQEMLRTVPFRPFILILENGQRIMVEHPECISFRPETEKRKGSEVFHVFADQMELHSRFDGVTSVALMDDEGLAG